MSGGASLRETGSRKPGLASRPGPAGFDPARWRAETYEGKPRHLPKAEYKELNALLEAARQHIANLTPYRQGVLFKAARSVSPINCGWQHYKLAEMFVFELAAIVDRNPEGGDAKQGSVACDESAAIAQNTLPKEQ